MRAVNDSEDLRVLLRQQQNYLPHSSTIYGIIANELEYGVYGHLNSQIYVPDTSLDSGLGSSLVVVYPAYDDVPNKGCIPLAIFWDCNAENDSDIAEKLLSIPNLDWELSVSVLPAPIVIIEKLKSILESDHFSCRRRELTYLMDGHVYALHKCSTSTTTTIATTATISTISIPAGFKLRALIPEDLEYIKSQTSQNYEEDSDVCTQLRVLPSAGLTTTDMNGCEVLVSWTTVRFNGEIGRSFTVPEYRGRGLAKVVTANLANQMHKSRETVYVSIGSSNTASIRYNTAIGFQQEYPAGIATINPSE